MGTPKRHRVTGSAWPKPEVMIRLTPSERRVLQHLCRAGRTGAWVARRAGTSPCSSPKLLDGAALLADCRAHRAAGAASDMIEWPAPAARRATRAAVSPRRGIPERGRPRRIAG